jgi:AraC-like DNA-binding protein
MQVKKFTPSAGLAKFIKCYYYIENTEDRIISDTFFADGCIEAVFSLGWDFYKDGAREDWAKIIGQIIKPRHLSIAGKGRSFGIWFHTHTFSYFSNLPMFEINDCVLSWNALFPNSIAEFVGNCMYERKFDILVKGVDDFLSKKVSLHKEKPVDRLTESAVQYLSYYKSGSNLNHLASRLNVSQRHLQKAFLTKIGFSQKHFVRIVRFQEILQNLTLHGRSSLTALAYKSDYYDQSHFIREFKAFTGFCPSEFEPGQLPINQHFIAPD